MEDKVRSLVNLQRSWYDLAALRTDERLRLSARLHSAEMARQGVCAHQVPGEPDTWERMLAVGYAQPAGENVAFGLTSAASVVEAWMRSPGHRANILHPDFAAIGVGLFISDEGHWWTQNFGY